MFETLLNLDESRLRAEAEAEKEVEHATKCFSSAATIIIICIIALALHGCSSDVGAGEPAANAPDSGTAPPVERVSPPRRLPIAVIDRDGNIIYRDRDYCFTDPQPEDCE